MRFSCDHCPDEYDCCKDCAREWRKVALDAGVEVKTGSAVVEPERKEVNV